MSGPRAGRLDRIAKLYGPPLLSLSLIPDPLAEVEADDGVSPVDEIEQRSARITVDDHGQRLDKWLVSLAGEFSRNHLQTLIEAGLVRIDGRVATSAARRVSAGQWIEVGLRATAETRAFRPEPEVAARWGLVFQDEHLMVIDKPVGMVAHPAPGNWAGTLLNGLLAHHPAAAGLPRAGIVHRLDKDTSGLMVVARTLTAMTALARAIAAREVNREYLALIHGVPRQATWSIDTPIGRDPISRVKMAVLPGGKLARTDVQTLGSADGVAAVHCRLHTGRTHQIRVHLASRGHPLVGDLLYGGRTSLGLSRQALHAARLSFLHPVGGQPLRFEAALPPDLEAAWQQVMPSGSALATMLWVD